MTMNRTRTLGTLAVITASMCYGTLALFGKLATNAGFTVPALLFWRFLAGGIVLWLMVAVTRKSVPKGRDALAAGGIGLFFAAMSTAYFIALVRAGAAYAVLTLYAYPAIVVGLEHALGNRINRRRFAAVVLAIGGVALLVHPGNRVDGVGIAIGLLSAVFYGVYLVITSRVMKTLSPLPATAIIVSTMAPIFGIAGLATHANLHLSGESARLIALLAVVSTAAPIALLSWGIARVGAPRAAVLGTLEPLTGVLLVTLLGGEHLDALQIAGGALLMLSSAVPDKPVTAVLEG